MGFSFAGYRKELSSKGFIDAYEGMRSDCPVLFSFADHVDLIAFFHDQTADLDRKDAVLFELVIRYRDNRRRRDIVPLFIVLFTPALASIYTYARRRHPGIDREDLIQDLCFFLIQIIQESDITPYKVASRIIGELRNRVRGLFPLIPDEEFVTLKGDGTDSFETGHACVGGDDAENDIEGIVMEITAFLDRLIRAGKITMKDKRILLSTFTGGKSLKDIASTREYERLKHRRRQVMEHIKKYSASS